ncbi:cobalt transporter CbiM [Arcobacter roscoffensis]|uniref:Cobalt transporter CbiM n=1 Tax=Arcobacter roscoffensis TaxID=2961520 RepID=A0ABY5E5I7_9BACT|nr:cobalt transporter CbiM [Arcobacter roscoffensis]UTJ06035.1 cobalt transporter CbiM [Arcobacter roscoffensis]
MHISDGVLSIEVASTLGVVSLALCAYSIKSIKSENISLVAAMSALFFIASFIHIPLGPTQIHLLLIGVIGLFLGKAVFLSLAIALLLQALLLGYGGLTSLGANIIIMALPAFLVYLLNKLSFFKKINEKIRFFLYGSLGIAFSVILLALVLYFAKDEYLIASYSLIIANIPAIILEGLITLFLLLYIKKSIPKLLKEANV